MKHDNTIDKDIEIIPIGKPLQKNGLYFVFSKKTGKFRKYSEKLCKFIKELHESGQMQELMKKNYTKYSNFVSQSMGGN